MNAYDITDFAEKVLSSEVKFEGRLLKLRVDTVQLPDGGTSTREMIEHPGAAAVVPLTADGCVYLVRQWRHPIHQVTLEVPAGTLSAGEDALSCARRELTEEIGMAANKIEHLLDIFVSLGYSNEIIGIYLGTGLRTAAGTPDADEKLQVVKVGLDEAVRLCLSGGIQDAKSIAALLAVKLRCLGIGAAPNDAAGQFCDQRPSGSTGA